MRSMSMYDLTLYLIVLALLEALCWWLGAWFFAALFLALYAVFAVASLRNDLILRYDRVIVVLRGKPYPLEWEDVERVKREYRLAFEPVYRFTLKKDVRAALPAQKLPLDIYTTSAVRRIIAAHMEIDESARDALREFLRHPWRRDGR
ncbi:MAG TPA: hypothetical protein IAA71_11075 [Candidatus Pullichristensenella stercoripullorum]|nr:hypothetical protein [Candidatus Pullichristensenella stercoripullorum]